MTPYLDALAILRDAAMPLPGEQIPTHQALNRVLAEDFIAPFALPRFDNSNMDGFAVRAADTTAASAAQPLTLPVLRAQAAGDPAGQGVSHHAIQVMTGGAIPEGMDSVVPIECVTPLMDTSGNVTQITLTQPVPHHDSVRFAGDDFPAGKTLIHRGTRLRSSHIAVLFATGTHQVRVAAQPGIRIFTTGKEVSDNYTAPLEASQIYDSNTPYLISAFESVGLSASYAGHVGDDEEKFRTLLASQNDARILVSSGAVSKGKWDFIPGVLQEFGAEILFHRVSIKPGKPVLFARLPDNRYFFGLPGNPISTAIGLRFFMVPLLRQLLGMAPESPSIAKLTRDYVKTGPLRLFLKSHIHADSTGQQILDVLNGQESFKIAPFLETNGWAIFEEAPGTHKAGDPVAYYPTELLT